MFWGVPEGALEHAVPYCTPAHGPAGALDVFSTVIKASLYSEIRVGHKVGGNPQFDGWPRWDSVTHQSMHVDWLRRAWQGGLRLMVMLAVNNEYMCRLPGVKRKGFTCNDMDAVDRQLRGAVDMETAIDSQAGGPGRGWYRIVRSPQEAAAAIAGDKLAVVLGIEVDYLFASYLGHKLSEAQVAQQVKAWFDRGVRYIFPIHFGDNLFGGAAYQNGLKTAGPVGLAGIAPFYHHDTVDGAQFGYRFRAGWPYDVEHKSSGHINAHGLTDLGKFLLHELSGYGILWDVDHMSRSSRSDALNIAETLGYPAMSGHTGLVDLCRGNAASEGQLTADEVERVYGTGGMISPIVRQGSIAETGTWTRPAGRTIPHTCSNSSNSFAQAYLYLVDRAPGHPIAIGTDLNGFAGLPGPRFGSERCPGNGRRKPGQQTGITYPFTSVSGQELGPSQIGQKRYDMNVDGLAHVGMLPDLIADLSAMGLSSADLQPLVTSAQAWADTWSKAWAKRTK